MNQPNRRSMTAALQRAELPPEALELITAGTPQPRAVRAPDAVDPVRPPALAPLPEPILVSTPASAVAELFAPPAKKAAARPAQSKPVPPAQVESISPVNSITVRLPGDLPQQLLRASLERKLRRLRPYTQQEIVASALREWLRANPVDAGE